MSRVWVHTLLNFIIMFHNDSKSYNIYDSTNLNLGDPFTTSLSKQEEHCHQT